MEEKELRQLAIDVSEKKVFGTFHMSENDMNCLQSVFMPIVFMSEEQRQKLVDDNIIHFYEYYDKAGPRAINGMPCFTSMMNINKQNWEKVVKYIKEYEVKVKSFLNKDEKKEPEGPTLFEDSDEDNKQNRL